ncbi:MAG: relaxase [Pedobacter sp.]|nr:MAG: relaxase [Pedobacter sp.]
MELRDKLQRFEELTIRNGRAKTNAIHVMLNFDREDKLSIEKFQSIAVDYMERIGFGEQPFLVYQHRDASHPHIHIVTTNIQDNGDRISIHNIGRDKDEKIREAMQYEYGLIRAESRMKDPMIKGIKVGPAQYGEEPTRQSIYNIVTAVMREYKFTSLAEYNAVLREFNVVADRGKEDSRMFERKGLVYAVLEKNGKRIGVPIKASSLAGKPTLVNVEAKFESNRLKRKTHLETLKNHIDSSFSKSINLSRDVFASDLRYKNIGVIFRQNDAGQIYGVTYVDHNTRCVFNGSDLGKAYSARALLDKFSTIGLSKGEKINPIRSMDPKNNIDDRTTVRQNDHGDRLLATLFQKPDFDPAGRFGSRKKKKKKKGSSVEQDTGNQIR